MKIRNGNSSYMTEIRSLIPAENWKHCPGIRNPADIPSRGVSATDLQRRMSMWLYGPPHSGKSMELEKAELATLPKECLME